MRKKITVEEKINLQGSPYLNDVQEREIKVGGDLSQQYLTTGNFLPFPTARTLNKEYDEFTCKLGFETLRKMSADNEIFASVEIYISAILSKELTFLSPIHDIDNQFYKKGQQVAAHANMMKNQAPFSWEEQIEICARNFLNYGTSALEQTFTYSQFRGSSKSSYNISELRPITVDSFRLVVDNFNRTLGMLPQVGGFSSFGSITGYIPVRDNETLKVVPKEKFTLFGFNRTSDDPRGRAIIFPAYPSWWLKQQLLLEFSAFIKRFAHVIWGTVPANAIATKTVVDGVTKTNNPIEQLNIALTKLRNGSASAFPHGTLINTVDMSGGGDFFVLALKMLDLQMTRAILRQHLASGEGEHQARSASEVHQDILILGIKQIKDFISRTLRYQMMRTWTILNYGADYAFLTPIPSLGMGNGSPLDASTIIDLTKAGYLTEEQKLHTDLILDLPPRTLGEETKTEDLKTQTKDLLKSDKIQPENKEVLAKASLLLEDFIDYVEKKA